MTYYRFESGAVFDLAHVPTEGTKLSEREGKHARAEYCKAELREILQPGSTVYTVLRHVSSSGMQRRIDMYAIVDNEPRYLSMLAADAMGDRLHKDGGIIVNGCGMDMGFHLVCNLGATLWPEGTPAPHGMRNGKPDSTGGYALEHQWL
jgi:hypothetical protein